MKLSIVPAAQVVEHSRDLFGDFVGFVEFNNIFFTESGEDWQDVVGTGVTWEGLEDTVIEGGVSDAADDFNVFVTLVQRF